MPRGWTSWWIAPNSAGLMIRTATRATRTSVVGRGDGVCWRRTFVRFYAPGVNKDEIQAPSERLLNLTAPY